MFRKILYPAMLLLIIASCKESSKKEPEKKVIETEDVDAPEENRVK